MASVPTEHGEADEKDQEEIVGQCIGGDRQWNYKKRGSSDKTAEQSHR
ncbi:MAG: hypothetical protein JWN74_1911 [Acidobacteriaceae bacterium]|nr:hypothetical protein [Acidobacteriaceae bacterium]